MRRRRSLPAACSRHRTPPLTPYTCWPTCPMLWTPHLPFVTSTCPTTLTATPSTRCASSFGAHNTRPPCPWRMHAHVTWHELTIPANGGLLSQLFCRISFHVHAQSHQTDTWYSHDGSLVPQLFRHVYYFVCVVHCLMRSIGIARRGTTRCTAVRGWMTWRQTRCWPALSRCARQLPRWGCATRPCLRIMRARAWRLHPRLLRRLRPIRPRARAAWGSASAPASARSSTPTLSRP